MNRQEIVTLLQLQQGAKLVEVAFGAGERHYTYKCITIKEPRIGDMVVVETAKKIQVATIVGLPMSLALGEIDYGDLRHVICRVDLTPLVSIKHEEQLVMQKLAASEISEALRKAAEHCNLAGLATPRLIGQFEELTEK